MPRIKITEAGEVHVKPDYEADILINKDALDDEWLDQPERFLRYSVLCAKARDRMDRAQQNLDVVKAERAQHIRSKPEVYGKPGRGGEMTLTEAGVSEALTMDEEVRYAQEVFLAAKHEWDVMLSAVRAFDQRKDALENLVRLGLAGYFATPTAPRDTTPEERQQLRDGARAAAVKKIRARKED